MPLELVKELTLCEVGLRDGLQNEKATLSTEQKVGLIEEIAAAGFPVIEIGSFVSPKAVPQMADTDAVFAAARRHPGVEYRALIANQRGVERAAACGCNKVKLNVSASVAHNLANLNCTPIKSVAAFEQTVRRAGEYKISVSGSISMAFGSPWDAAIPISGVKEIVSAYLDAGVDEISLSDASGMAFPSQVYAICCEMRESFPQVSWWLHFHNTRGVAMANILAGMQAGFFRYDSAFAGVGGCPFVPGAAGNVSTEDLLHLCEEMGIATGINLDRALDISRKVVAMLGHATDSYLLRAGKSKDLIRSLPTKQGANPTLEK